MGGRSGEESGGPLPLPSLSHWCLRRRRKRRRRKSRSWSCWRWDERLGRGLLPRWASPLEHTHRQGYTHHTGPHTATIQDTQPPHTGHTQGYTPHDASRVTNLSTNNTQAILRTQNKEVHSHIHHLKTTDVEIPLSHLCLHFSVCLFCCWRKCLECM